MTTKEGNATYECPNCNSDLTKPESVMSSFYIKGETTEVIVKAHYLEEPEDTLPKGTLCIDTHNDTELDEEIHPDNDVCSNCKEDVCADTIAKYRAYLLKARNTDTPIQTYEEWR